MTYDKLNRLTGIAYPSDISKNTSFTYDTNQSGCNAPENFSKGRLTRMVDASGSTKLCCDNRGNVRRKIQVSGGQTLTTQYRYDLSNRISSLTYPSGAVVNYGRDAQGRLSTANLVRGSTTISLVTNAGYPPFGPLSNISFGNGQSVSKTYDQNYDIDRIQSPAIDYDYQTDEDGNIKQIIISIGSVNTQNYGYDKLYRLTNITDANAALIEAFTYDATGNRLTQQDAAGLETYGYSASNHRLNQLGPVARTADANGNTLSGIAGFGGDQASYDVRNRLNQVGSNRYQANFNARGERTVKSVNGIAARGQNLPNPLERPLDIAALPNPSGSDSTKPSGTGSDTKPPIGVDPIDPDDLSGGSDGKENAWINAVAGDWTTPGLTATSYDESGQVLSYRQLLISTDRVCPGALNLKCLKRPIQPRLFGTVG